MSRLVWYKEGVHFGCTQCGKCCTGGPGAVWISEEEAQSIADYLKIPVEIFYEKYTRQIAGKRALQELSPHFDCVFLREGKFCDIYPTRPIQCKTFPFWPGVMNSKEQWEDAARYCEGIRPDAPLVPFEAIQEQLELHKKCPDPS